MRYMMKQSFSGTDELNTLPRTFSLCKYLECIIMLFDDCVYILYDVLLHVDEPLNHQAFEAAAY